MATRNEYEMLFKLSAQLGQDFNGTFSSAQKTLAATQKEIQSLNKLQSDISSYAKQQQSVDALINKLFEYKQQLNAIQEEIAASGEFNESLAYKEFNLEKHIEQTELTLKKKTEALNRLETSLSEAGVNTANFSGETQRLGQEIAELKEQQEKAADEAENLGNVGSNAATAVGEAITAAGIAALLKEVYEAYSKCVTEAAAWAGTIDETSKLYGIDTDSLQSLYYAAELVDVSVETVTSSVQKNIKSMGEAQRGSAMYAEAYEKLGVSITNTDGTLRNGTDVYWDVIDALGEMENEAERDTTAMQLLGRSAMQLNSLIQAGSGTIDEFSKMAHEAGYVMDQEMLDVMCALDDELMFQQKNFQALKNTIGTQYAPEITAALQIWNDMLAGMTEFTEENPALVKTLVSLGLSLTTVTGALVGYVAITKTAAIVQTSLNAAMSANPIGLTLGAVSALTVGIISLSSAMSDAAKKEEEAANQLSYVSQKQLQELEALNSEYEKICELYGETSYQAQELSWEIDKLQTEYESSKQTMVEYRKELEDSSASYRAMVEEHEKAVAEVQKESASLISLVYRLDELTQHTGVAVSEQQEILAIIRALNAEIPGLSLSYDQLTNKMSSSTDAIMALVEAEAATRQYEQYYETLVKKVSSRSGLKTEWQTAIESQTVAQEQYNAKVKEANAWFEKHKHAINSKKNAGIYGKYIADLRELGDALNEASAELENAQTKFDDNEREIANLTNMMVGLNGSIEDVSDSERSLALAANAVYNGYMSSAQAAAYYKVSTTNLESKVEILKNKQNALSSALTAVRAGFLTADEAAEAFKITIESFGAYREITAITDEITALSDAYQEAYREAYDSVSGQYQLWDKAAEVIPTEVEIINAALETQTAYWHDYNVDLQSLRERSADIEGLSEVIASFADGSKESVNTVAGMAQMTDDELGKMVANWRALQEEQRSASESLATMDSDYVAELELLQNELKATINDLNLAEEAENAANETMDAYIEALKAGADEAATIAQQLATQIGISLNTTNGVITVSGASAEAGTVPVGGSPSLGREIISGGVSKSAVGTKPLVPRKELSYHIYHTGGLVGDVATLSESEEFAKLLEGEFVSSPAQMKRFMEDTLPQIAEYRSTVNSISAANPNNAAEAKSSYGAKYDITISPQFTLQGVNSDNMEDKFLECGEMLVDMVIDKLEEIGIDAKRSAYA